VWRLALVGFAGVLLAVTGFGLWAATRTSREAVQAGRLASVNDAYQQARSAITTETSLEHRYYVHPGRERRATFEQAAASLVAALQFVAQHGDAQDRARLETLTAEHGRYVAAMRRLFAAVDAGDLRRAQAIDERMEPSFQAMEASIDRGADRKREETLAGLASLRRQVVTTTPIIFTAGGVALAAVLAVLAGYHRRTERQAAQNQHQALHDALTGLPNRTLLRDRTAQAIRQADRELCPAALLLLDLDRFKEINDTLGHRYGDQLLIHVGERLRGRLRQVDTVARLGGDEFAVLLPRIETAEGAVTVASKLQVALAEPFVLDGLTLDVEASIGLAIYPDHGGDADELLQRADIAMYVPSRHTPDSRCSTPSRTSTAPAGWPCWASCATPSSSGSWCCTTSPRSTPTAGRCSASRRWCAGSTPPMACSHQRSSSRWRSGPD
jgi:diguanylate cyclase (GGDEF)-like protein